MLSKEGMEGGREGEVEEEKDCAGPSFDDHHPPPPSPPSLPPATTTSTWTRSFGA